MRSWDSHSCSSAIGGAHSTSGSSSACNSAARWRAPAGLIDDSLDLSRIEAGRISVSTEPVDATEVSAEVVKTLEPMAQRVQITISALACELPNIVADRTRLAQILMNFGSNAIKYGKPGGHVTVSTQRRLGAVRISVIDDGIGIPGRSP